MTTHQTALSCWILFLTLQVAPQQWSTAGIENAVRILNISVPSIIRTGRDESVILDCDYEVNETERIGLVIKWYFSGHHLSPIYQWIPTQKPQVVGILRGKVNLNYKASEDRYKMYRAMQIVRPTSNLSGDYTCKISTFVDEDVRSRKMIVYTPTENLTMIQKKVSDHSVNVTCLAQGVYPEPRLLMYYREDDVNRVELPSSKIEILKKDYSFDVWVYHTLENNILPEETIFECHLWIPGTPFELRKMMLYYPHDVSPRVYHLFRPEKEPKKWYSETPFIGIPTYAEATRSRSHTARPAILLLSFTGITMLLIIC